MMDTTAAIWIGLIVGAIVGNFLSKVGKMTIPRFICSRFGHKVPTQKLEKIGANRKLTGTCVRCNREQFIAEWMET